MRRKLQIGALAIVMTVASFGYVVRGDSDGSTVKPVDFDRDIRPILSDNCFTCHGPDERQRKAGLRFDIKEIALGKPGVIVAGDSTKSRLIQRITAEDPAMRMPPPESGRSLTDKQIALLRRWIDEGAKWATHWAYIPPVRPEVPKVGDTSWPRNAIDYFVLARLEREGLKPSPEAEKETLLRRVSYDLTGLPPTAAEMDSFLADKSPDAYEKQVDRLLRSPHYGEQMAMQWLDLARYADTHGHFVDSQREMWPWRDWVIKAFNKNMPFDQFTVEQLAGDLLPDATTDQKIASGFNRNHMINWEGGAIPEEWLVEYVVDRAATTSNVWMGMTMGCARCHDHKYDPITQKEFYQFFGFFNNVPENGLDGTFGNAKPFLSLPSPQQKARLEEIKAAVKEKETALADKEARRLLEDWEKLYAGKVAQSPRDGLSAHYEFDGNLYDISGHYQHGRTITGGPTFEYAGKVGKAATFDGDTRVSFGNIGSMDHTGSFSLAVWLKPIGNTAITALQKIQDPESRRGYELLFDDVELFGFARRASYLKIRLTSHWPDNAIELRTKKLVTHGEWHHIVVTYDGSGRAAGLKLYIDGKLADVEILKENLSGPVATAAELQVGDRQLGNPFKGDVDDLRLYDRPLTSDEVDQLAVHYPIHAILSGAFGKRTKEEAARLREYFLTCAAPERLRSLYSELKDLNKQESDLVKAIPTAMVMAEMEKPRDTFVLARGDYRNKTEKVTPGVPAVLPPLPKDAPPNRLTLAKWLVDASHPLTARVTVNRFWQMYFGTGLVKTSEDFGSQGEPPSHPELLDWLASEFTTDCWDIRAMQRLIVTSATYRQSSRVNPKLLEKDRENRLLARGPRMRLPAELIRDNALAASGLLNSEVGGPSVFPYQPKGLWEEMAVNGEGFSAQSYTQSKGKDLYRRSMYTFWKRTVPPPSLITFDAPSREKCTARRTLTNTPLQALVLMNDPTYIEAARVLAQRAMTEGGAGLKKRIGYAFRLATAREPSEREAGVLSELFAKQLKHYRRDKQAALELLTVGESRWNEKLDGSELAAMTTVASAILSLNETITKE